MRLVLLGPPGAGKGTQARVLSQRFQIPTIATGNMLRDHIGRKTALGIVAKGFIDNGLLVPDDAVWPMVQERLQAADTTTGFLLDGFPRTVVQAEQLRDFLATRGRPLHGVVDLSVPDDEIVRRLSNRRICPKCQTPYHMVERPPERDEMCDRDGEKLVQRDDDLEHVIRKRLQEYHRQTEPLVEWYRRVGLLHEIDGEQSPEDVTEIIGRIVDETEARINNE